MFPCGKGTPLAAPLLPRAYKDDGIRHSHDRVPRRENNDATKPSFGKIFLAFLLVKVALVLAAGLCARRLVGIFRPWVIPAPASPALGGASAARDEAASRSFLMKREAPSVLPADDLVQQNGQDRPRERLGKKHDGFVHLIDHTAAERQKEMTYLQQVRRDASRCGGDMKSTWKSHPQEYTYNHFANAAAYQDWLAREVPIQRYSCDARHPQHYDDDKLQVRIERLGPFHGTGNGDWSSFMNYEAGGEYDDESIPPNDKLLMRDQVLAHKDVYIRGSFISLVTETGEFHSYPPLHMHHLHVHPYHDSHETRDKLLPKRTNGTPPEYDIGIVGGGSAFMDHHLIAQQHGDSLCHADGVDDFSCLLHLFPPGHGMRVRGSEGFRLDFEVNDVRAPDVAGAGGRGLEPLEYYVEIALLWTPTPQIPSTFLHVAAPEAGQGPSTYAVPLDASSSMIYFNYTHDWRDDEHLPNSDPRDEQLAAGVRGVQGLGAGTLSNIVLHAHQTMFDALFIFKESNQSRKVFEAIDTLRPKDQYLPYIPECHKTTLEEIKDRVTKLAMRQGGGELVCEVTKPGLVWTQTPSGSVDGAHGEDSAAAPPSYAYRDRLTDLHCRKNLRLEPGDTLTFLSFTKSRPSSTLGPVRRGSSAARVAGIFERPRFAQSEHTILRMDFVSDKARAAMTKNNIREDAEEDAKENGESEAPKTVAGEGLYAPPGLYLTQRWVRGAPDEACFYAMQGKQWFSFVNKNIEGWDALSENFGPQSEYECLSKISWLARLNSMMNQCPESISLSLKETKSKKDQMREAGQKRKISALTLQASGRV